MAKNKGGSGGGLWWWWPKPLLNRFVGKKIRFHLCCSALVHLVLIAVCEVQDRLLEVKYTDIDYVIFTDGARMVQQGRSPFDRATYRYTPLLAWCMLPNVHLFANFGKLLFSALDLLSGWLLYSILPSSVPRKLCALAWLYNPLTIIISTRGSSESIICTMVLASIFLLLKKRYISSGLLYGFVIHFKIYPAIYAISFYLVISQHKSWRSLWPNSKQFIFFVNAFIGFVVPTVGSYRLYGKIYLDEAWLYHFTRQDLQHNFSPYFYLYQLNEGEHYRRLLSYVAFLPQVVLLVASAFFYLFQSKREKDFFMALFIQTYVFVTLNKVITAQYFVWYMCLLPLVVPFIRKSFRSWIYLFVIWSFAILQWLLPAYLFEFRKWQCLRWLGTASFVFVFLHLAILVYLHVVFNRQIIKIKNKHN